MLEQNYGVTTITVTTPSNAKYLLVYLYSSAAETMSLQTILDSVQIELGAEATEYEEYRTGMISDLTHIGNTNPYRYSGYYYDIETNNYYLMARYYNPNIARFITEDPYRGELNDPLSLNRYVYVNNNPLIYYDPSGHFGEGIWNWYKESDLYKAGAYIGTRTAAAVVGVTEMAVDSVAGTAGLIYTEAKTALTFADFGLTELAYNTGMISEDNYWNRIDKIDKSLKKSEEILSAIPQIPGAIYDNAKQALDVENIIKYWDPNTTDFEFLKDQSKATVSTALTAYGGYKMVSGGLNAINNWAHPKATASLPNGVSNIGYDKLSQMNGSSTTLVHNSPYNELNISVVNANIINSKIESQMGERGWTKERINNTTRNPYTTRDAVNKANNNPSTAYYNQDGSYVVRDNITNQIIQISKVGNKNWIPDSTIVNPYKPNK